MLAVDGGGDRVEILELPVAGGVDGDGHRTAVGRDEGIGLVNGQRAQIANRIVLGTGCKQQCRQSYCENIL